MAKVACLFLLVIALASAAGTRAEARTWTDRKGRQLEAEYLGFWDGKVKIRRAADGQVFDVSLDTLSDADQAFVRSQQPPAPIERLSEQDPQYAKSKMPPATDAGSDPPASPSAETVQSETLDHQPPQTTTRDTASAAAASGECPAPESKDAVDAGASPSPGTSIASPRTPAANPSASKSVLRPSSDKPSRSLGATVAIVSSLLAMALVVGIFILRKTLNARRGATRGLVSVHFRCPACNHSWTATNDPHCTPVTIQCPNCSHEDEACKVAVGGILALAGQASKAEAHALAAQWWESSAVARSSAVCDDCGSPIPRGNGYLCNPANLRLGCSPDLVCHRCFDRTPHEPWNEEETARKIKEGARH